MTIRFNHLILLGDLLFNNAVYVPNGFAVIDHVQALLPRNWQATLVARDRDVVTDVAGQLPLIPNGTTHI